MSVRIFNDGRGLHIHRTGCKDLSRGENKFWALGAEIFPTVDEAFDAYVDKGDPNNPGWVEADFKIHNCTK